MLLFCKAAAFVGIQYLKCQNGQKSVPLLEQNFIKHIKEYGLRIGTKEEYQFRFQLYQQLDAKINEINARQNSFKVGHNKFSTLTDFEAKKYAGLDQQSTFQELEPTILDESKDTDDHIDWVYRGYVRIPVRDQMTCGSCWAFSATCAIESAYNIKYNRQYYLSEQQFIDCDASSNGCEGGYPQNAFTYAISNSLMEQKDYPYANKQQQCQAKNLSQIYTDGFRGVQTQSSSQLRAAIKQQPVSVYVDASSIEFKQYTGGVFTPENCGTNVDHAVVAVGYQYFASNNTGYYKVRNSWGFNWGDNGYIFLSIQGENGDGTCGIQKYSPIYPIIH